MINETAELVIRLKYQKNLAMVTRNINTHVHSDNNVQGIGLIKFL